MQNVLRIALMHVFYLTGIAVNAQFTYVKRAGSPNGDYALTCYPTKDGGTIIAEASATNGTDLHSGLVKCDSNGNMQWSKLYRIGEYAYPFTVLPAKEDGYMVLVTSLDSALINYNHFIIALYKTDSLGNTQWNKQFSFTNSDLPLNLVYRKNGGYISFTYGEYNTGTYPSTIVSTHDDNGTIIWSKKYSLGYGLKGVKGIEMPNRNICFAGTVSDPSNPSFTDVIVTMLDPSGGIVWTKTVGTYYDDEPWSLAANFNNEIFITGRNYFINRQWDAFLLRFDSAGNKTGSMVYDAGTYDGEAMRCVLAFDDGSCKLLGDMGTFDERDMVMLNIDSSLMVESTCRYAFSPMFTNYPFDFHKTNDGGLIFTGDYRPPVADRDAILVKTESDGSLPCFMSRPVFTEHNETFHDYILSVNVQPVTATQRNFPDTIPLNPFLVHTVCALTAEVPEEEFLSPLVFPNPVSDHLSIQFNADVETIQIINMEGKIIFESKENRNQNLRIDMSHLSPGIYSIKYISDEKISIGKIVKS